MVHSSLKDSWRVIEKADAINALKQYEKASFAIKS
jgi:hypothetical protein